MITDQHIEALVKEARSGTLRMDLDEVILHLSKGGEVLLPFPAWLTIEDGESHFYLRIPRGQKIPLLAEAVFPEDLGVKIYGAQQCHKISARTATSLKVELEDVSPSPCQINDRSGVITYRTSFDRLALPAENLDALSTAEIMKMLNEAGSKRVRPRSPEGEKVSPENNEIGDPEDEVFAIIPKVDLLIFPDGKETVVSHPFLGDLRTATSCCFFGEINAGRFCVEKRDGDMWIHLRRPIGTGRIGDVRALFQGVLTAIGYLHACHPWPLFLEHRRNHRVVERWLHTHPRRNLNPLTPIAKGRSRRSKDAQSLFHSAAVFFAGQSEDAKFFSRALWLMREGNYATMAYDVRLLTLCSVLEGIVKRFTKAGKQVGDEAAWKSAVRRAGLDWDDWFYQVYESWRAYRNNLAHGFDLTDAPTESALIAYSRISAAIYILMAKRMGFRGEMERSQLEGKAMVSLGDEVRF